MFLNKLNEAPFNDSTSSQGKNEFRKNLLQGMFSQCFPASKTAPLNFTAMNFLV
jgi:hypothetical protein